MFDLIKGAIKGIAAEEGYFLSNIEIMAILLVLVIMLVVLMQLIFAIWHHSNINNKFRRVYRRQTRLHECIQRKAERSLQSEIDYLRNQLLAKEKKNVRTRKATS